MIILNHWLYNKSLNVSNSWLILTKNCILVLFNPRWKRNICQCKVVNICNFCKYHSCWFEFAQFYQIKRPSIVFFLFSFSARHVRILFNSMTRHLEYHFPSSGPYQLTSPLIIGHEFHFFMIIIIWWAW